MAETPLQPAHPVGPTDFRIIAPFSFMPSQTGALFSSLAEGSYAPQPTADYDHKVLDWVPPTPGDSAAADAAAAAWEAPAPAAGLPRPQPQRADAALIASAPASAERSQRSESPIDVVTTSAFAPVDPTPRTDEVIPEIARPQPLRVDALDAASVNPLLMLSSDQQLQQPTPIVTLASAFVFPSDTVVMSAEPGPSSAESSNGTSNNVSPPSRGCYTRAPGLGPPPETPTSGNDKSGYVCTVCGFSCASKFHYNSHMNTHGDHQCSMCDYTSRTEGRLKKHMRDSHTVEEQLAAGLDLTPQATPTKDATDTTPTKNGMEVEVVEGAEPATGLPSPRTLSSTLMGMIATSTASSMTSALEQMRAITEQPLMGDGSTEGLLLVGTPLGLSLPMREDGGGGGGGGGRRKTKLFKCKQCDHISTSKEERWSHARSHIPCDKQMSCSKCNFVTEYKHHLEYHMRNHDGVKPFQCKKCAYTCVNKSMLNSHMKSHSNVYQFRCADCNYATKYCHSLKLHLKKYGHRRNTEGMSEADILNSMSADSSPPSMRKDSTASIASSLSGPFTPFGLIKREEPTTPLATPTLPNFALAPQIATSQSLSYATQMLLRQHQFEAMRQASPALKCCMCEFSCGSQEELLRHNITHFLSNGMANGNLYQALGVQASLGIPDRSNDDDHHTTTGSPSGDDAVSHSNGSAGSPLGSGRGSSDEGESGSSRRKSKQPTRIDEIGLRLIDKASPDTVIKEELKDDEEAMDTTDASATVELTASSEQLVLPQLQQAQPLMQPLQLLQPQPQHAGGLLAAMGAAAAAPAAADHGLPAMAQLRQAYLQHLVNQTRANPAELFVHKCGHCTLGFGDHSIYQLHMSFHSPDNPLQCTRCGVVCTTALHFNIHLLQSNHL